MRSLLEEFYDLILFLLGICGLSIFFTLYWGNSYKQRYVEMVVQTFLDNVSAEGGFSKEEYEGMVRQLKQFDAELSVELTAAVYEKEPVYANIPMEKLNKYYRDRNIRKQITLYQQLPVFSEVGEPMEKLQVETNATILAETAGTALPLPGDGETVKVTAVRPQQVVYEGEELITLCLVESAEGIYYMPAVMVRAKKTEKVQLQVYLGDGIYNAEVEVICVPDRLECENGHSYVNTRERVKEFLATGEKAECPFCKETPVSLSVSGDLITVPVGTGISEFIKEVKVTFLDGHVEYICPKDKGWQDDYDSNFCGLQTVTIRYYEAVTYCTVLTEGNICNLCLFPCEERCQRDYEAFPYCDYCMAQQYLFSGEVIENVSKLKQETISASVMGQGFFMMQKNDRLTVAVYDGRKLVSIVDRFIENDGRMETGQ